MQITSVVVYTYTDEDPDLSYLDQTDEEMGKGYEAFAKERKEGFLRGDWEMVGIVCDINIDDGRTDIIRSSIWGVESDSEPDHVRALGREMLSDARDMLAADERYQHLTFLDSDVEWEI
jgi:hypothetical protein